MAEDTKGMMDALVQAVQGYKQKEQAGTGGWVAAGVALVLLLVGLAVYAWQAWKVGKEHAKLLHEKAVQEEAGHQALIDASLALSKNEQAAAIAVAEAAYTRTVVLDGLRVELEEEHREVRERIDAIVSWDDVDRFLDRDR